MPRYKEKRKNVWEAEDVEDFILDQVMIVEEDNDLSILTEIPLR